jgi:hypothetical protein
MKRLYTGTIVFDWIDWLCLSFSLGASLSCIVRNYKNNPKGFDPIIGELKKESLLLQNLEPMILSSTDGDILKLPALRGGELKGVSFTIKSKKFAALLKKLFETKRKQKLVKLLQIFFLTINQLLNSGIGIRFAVGGSLEYTQIILLSLSGSVGGFLVGQIIENPLPTILLPLIIVFGREIEEIADPYEKCKRFCQIAEDFHNKEHLIEMQKLKSLIEETALELKLPIDKVPLLSVECVENKISILQRFKLRQLIENAKVKKRVMHFNEFIKKFPECSVDLEEIYQEVVEKIPE